MLTFLNVLILLFVFFQFLVDALFRYAACVLLPSLLFLVLFVFVFLVQSRRNIKTKTNKVNFYNLNCLDTDTRIFIFEEHYLPSFWLCLIFLAVFFSLFLNVLFHVPILLTVPYHVHYFYF